MVQKQTHIVYGFATGISMVIIGLILYVAGLAFNKAAQYISYIPFIVGIILNAMAYSKANSGAVTFGQVFGSCFKGAMIVTLVIVVWSVLSMYIFPDMKDKAMEVARQSMVKNPQMTDESIDAAMNLTRKYWNVFLIAGAIFGTLFFGALFSLVGAAVAKKNQVQPVGDNF